MRYLQANNIKGILCFRDTKPYLRIPVGRNPISGDLLFDEYLIQVPFISIVIEDPENALVFKMKTSNEKVLAFSDNPYKDSNVSQEKRNLDTGS